MTRKLRRPITNVYQSGTHLEEGGHSGADAILLGVPVVGGAEGARDGDVICIYHFARSNGAARSTSIAQDASTGQAAISVSPWTQQYVHNDGNGYLDFFTKTLRVGQDAQVELAGVGFDGGSTTGDTSAAWLSVWRNVDWKNPIAQIGTLLTGTPGDMGPIPGLVGVRSGNAVICYGGSETNNGYTAHDAGGRGWTGFQQGATTAGGNGSGATQHLLLEESDDGDTLEDVTMVTTGGAVSTKAIMVELRAIVPTFVPRAVVI